MTDYSGVSQATFDLIVAEEVSSQAAYTARYQHPERPGGASGITIGIGYDCGYADAAKIRSDWGGRLSESMVSALVGVSGMTGDAAQARLAGIKSAVLVPWAAAIDVFANVDIPVWAAKVRHDLQNTNRLSSDCFGVLVSLAYNRGASFSKEGDRYAEMRSIKAHMAAMQFEKIPDDIRSMKRLWTTPSVRGVATRRDHEATLFQRGLAEPAARQVQVILTSAPKMPASISVSGGGGAGAAPSITNPAKGSIGEFVESIIAAIFKRKS